MKVLFTHPAYGDYYGLKSGNTYEVQGLDNKHPTLILIDHLHSNHEVFVMKEWIKEQPDYKIYIPEELFEL